MKWIYLIWQKASSTVIFFVFWLAVQADVLAAPAKKAAGESGGGSGQSWVAPYALVLLAVGLGMLVVCRSSRRSDRAKPREYQSLHLGK